MKSLSTSFAGTLWWVAPIAIATLVVGLRFFQYFYSASIGDDYSYSIPRLLDGYYWFRNNGIVPQWYTAAFCGGLVAYADAQSMYYSIFQFLTVPLGPRTAVFSGIVLYAVAGGVGMIWLLRTQFGTTRFAASLGGVMFLSNGFLWSRAMVGHLNWVEFMLVPLLAGLLLQKNVLGIRHAGGVLAGLVLASFVYAGALNCLFPALLAVTLLATLSLLARKQVSVSEFLLETVVAGCVALLVSASKLMAVTNFVRNFPRDYYPLPGFDSLPALLSALVNSLFTLSFSDADEFGQHFVNSIVPITSREEWDFSVGVLPLLLLAGGLFASRSQHGNFWRTHKQVYWPAAIAAACLLLLPLAANIYSPGWNHFLKSLPIVSSMSLLVRLWAIYIPALIVVSVVIADRRGFFESRMIRIALLALTLVWTGARDWDNGFALGYDPEKIEQAYRDVKSGRKVPAIEYIGVLVNSKGQPFSPVGRDDVMTANVSQLLCYQPQFGYFLERFPRGALDVGSVYAEKNGTLNLKNPACYAEGEANGCAPGSHFKTSELEAARGLASYRNFASNFSFGQRFANALSLAVLLGTLGWLVRGIWRPKGQSRID